MTPFSTISRAALRPAFSHATRGFASTASSQQKVLAVLYKGGDFAKSQPRLLGTIENKLGLEKWLKDQGHEFVVTDDKEGPNSTFQKEIVDADVLITTPFHPGYATREVIEKAKNLKVCITAGVGSDHVDLDAANEKKLLVAEVSGMILSLVRNYLPANQQIINGGWNVAEIARNSFDLEDKVVGTLGAGRIGYRVLQRLAPFGCKKLLYYDYKGLSKEHEQSVKATKVEDLKEFLSQLDVLTINSPLHEGTKGLIDAEKIGWMKKGAWIINTARGAICNTDDIAEAVNSGKIAGYAGDVWYPQPAPEDHPWRTMKTPDGIGNGMTAHYSGTTLDAQKRYADGTKTILENYFNGKEQDPANVIVVDGKYASEAYGQR